jgi:hypothetical protein
LICQKCGENNSDNFRYCGMCGNVLEARRPAGSPLANSSSAPAPRTAPGTTSGTALGTMSGREPLQRPLVVENATRPANRLVPPISGPSMLGLDQPGPNQGASTRPDPNPPSLDALRDKAFSGLDSFFEPEQPKTSGRRILLMVVLLAALGGASWWTYTNYIGPAENRKASGQGASPTTDTSSSTDSSSSSPAAVPSASVPEGPSENASTAADSSRKAADTESSPTGEEKAPTPAPVTRPATSSATPTRIAPTQKIAAKREASAAAPRASSVPAPAAADTGDADFRKGEASLYGRGAPENCDEAVKYLKAASAKSNAKARGAFGTMYATGHCAPRDLPTSYLWFALALKVDPNNQILEKDLSAVWNQMTPPERQMATRMKQ